MAVLPARPKIRSWIECEGNPLQEYDDDNGDDHDEISTNTVTKYIEAKSGAEFEIQVELQRPFPIRPIRLKVFLDGKYTSWRTVDDVRYNKAAETLKQGFGSVTTKTAKGQCLEQRFCFSELQIGTTPVLGGALLLTHLFDSDDHTLGKKLPKNLKSLGLITLEVHYIKNLRMVPRKQKVIDLKSTIINPIPEKALKGRALTHQAGLGAVVSRPYTSSGHSRRYDYVDPRKMPFATFNFKYRSRAALKSLLIIPRSPSPVPLEDRDVETLTTEESHELIRRMREWETASRNLKQEHGIKREHSAVTESVEDDEVSIVSIAKRQRLHATANRDGVEIIDLT